MRLAWYAGASTALAATVTVSAFYQRANFYSAMVHLAQSNICVLVLANFIFLIYGTLMYGLQRLLFGRLRPTEIEQLSDNAWFAITETCLAMTTFRDEMGAWFLVMFTALVTGKVWGWIGDGRIEILEQQPPANPRLFHTRLATSLLISLLYDALILRYAVLVVIQQARPNMMVMFLFEFSILMACSARSLCRYGLCLVESAVVKKQTRQRLEERKRQARERRAAMLAEREANPEAAEAQGPLPDENDIDEMDIEVPGWEAKGQWVLFLELVTDFVKLGVYGAFFFILLAFYGLPVHIMRDLFMTVRSFFKSLAVLLRYRKALQGLRQFPDATEEDLGRDPTCIICREEMRPWDGAVPGAIERYRPKKLRCGHILHLGCLKSWLERQQVCPTCRTPVTVRNQPNNDARGGGGGGGGRLIAGAHFNFGFPPAQPAPQQNAAADGGGQNNPHHHHHHQQQQLQLQQRPAEGVRVINLGPVRVEFARGQVAANMAAAAAANAAAAAAAAPAPPPPLAPADAQAQRQARHAAIHANTIRSAIAELDALIQRDIQELQGQQLELQTLYLLNSELRRIRQMNQQQHQQMAQAYAQAHAHTQAHAQAHAHAHAHAQTRTHSAPPQQTQPPTQTISGQASGPAGPASHTQPPSSVTPQLPGFPSSFPSRLNTPSLTRQERVSRYSPSTSAAIPAGSPDLPDGVILPPGWSLLPLSRLDGQQVHIPQIPPGFANTYVGEGSSAPATPYPETVTPNPEAATPNPEAAGYDLAGAPTGEASEAPPVVAPNPVSPQHWGGPAQLFGGPGIESLESGVPTTVPEQAHEVDREGTAGSEAGARPLDKGKRKAATVEEGDDDDGQ